MAEGGRDNETLENLDNQANEMSNSVSSNPEKESDFVEVQEWQDNDGKNCTLPLWIKYKRAPDMKIIKCMKNIPCSWNLNLYWNFYTKTEPGKQMLHEILNTYNCSVAVFTEDEDLFIFEITEKIFEQESDVVQLIHVVLDNVYKCAQQFLYLDNILVDQRIQGDILQEVRQRKELNTARFELMGQQDFDALFVICTEKDQTFVLCVVTEIIHMVKECFENHEETIHVDHKWQKVMKTFGYLQKVCEKYPSVTISDKTEAAILLKGPRDQSKPAADLFLELLGTASSEVQEEIFSPGCQFEIFTYPEMCGYIDNITMELSLVWIPNHQTKKIHLFSKKSEQIKGIDRLIKGCVHERLYPLAKYQTVFFTKIISSLEEFMEVHTGKILFSSFDKGLLLTATDDIFENIDDAMQEIICKETQDLVEKHSAMLDQKQREHEAQIRTARMELERAVEISKSKERDYQNSVEELQGEITHRECHIINLKEEIISLKSSINNLNKDIASQEKEIQKVKSDTKVELKNHEEYLLKKYRAELDNLQADHIRESQKLVTQFNQAQELLKDKISELQIKSESCLDTESTVPNEEEIRKVEEASFLTLDGSGVPGASQLEMYSEDKEFPKVHLSFRTEVTKAVLNIIEDKLGSKGVDALISALRQVADVETSNEKIEVICDFKQAEEVQNCIFKHYQKATRNKNSVNDSMERHLIEGGNSNNKDLLEFAYGNAGWSKKLEVEGDKLYVLGTLSMKEKAEEAVQTITQWYHEEFFLTENEKQKADEVIRLVRSEFPELFIKQVNNNDKLLLNAANEENFDKAKRKIKVALGRIKITSRGRKSRSLLPEGESSLSLPQNDSLRQESSLMSPPSVYQTFQSRSSITSKTYYTREGITVKVYPGDIVSLPVDCIVNAANKNLAHCSGVALAIAKAAGREFDQESEEYVRRHGIIPVTQCCVTSAGRLPYRCVIHAVGPQWHDYKHNEKDKCGDDLKKTIVNCLIKATSLKINSIGIPSISSGIFGVPKDVCAQMYVQGVVEFSRTFSLQSDCVKEIHCVDMLPEMCNLTQLAFDNVFSSRSSKAALDNINLQEDSLAPSAERYPKAEVKTHNETLATIKPPICAEFTSEDQGSKQNPYIIKPWEKTNILIYKHDIADVVVDAVVCPVSPKVESGVVRFLMRVYSVKRECETYVTLPSKANLPLYIHIYSSWWTKPEEQTPGKTFEKLIKTSVQNIFNEVKKYQIATVALPIHDTGDKTTNKLICEYMMDGISDVYADPQMFPVGQITIHLVTNETSVTNQLKEIACQQFGQKCQVKGETLQTEDRSILFSKQHNLQVTVQNANSTGVTQRESCSSHSHSNQGDYANKKATCPVCLETLLNSRTFTGCGHVLCKDCMEHTVKNRPVCPVCGKIYKIITGNQPKGTMDIKTTNFTLPGFKKCGTIEIYYNFPGGIQTEGHPNPGQYYYGTSRHAYLPDNTEGRKVLSLLKKAFNRRLVFTVGRSVTTGVENAVRWNDIHHKTNRDGGPQNYGYPDADYLKRVQEELAAMGVTQDAI